MTFIIRNLVMIGCLLVSNLAISNSMDEQVEDYLTFLSATTLTSPLEGAGSHGSLGIGIGAGVGRYTLTENKTVIDDQLRERDEFNTSNPRHHSNEMYIPKVFFHKGFLIPVDLGGYFAKVPDTNASAAGVYAQWTLFEAFALPAVAGRVKYSKMMGLPSSEFQSLGSELVASYGLFSIFNVYTAIGLNRDEAEIRTSGETGTSLVLDPENRDQDYSRKQLQMNKSIGIQVQILPLYCTATLETQTVGDAPRSWLAKLSMGI